MTVGEARGIYGEQLKAYNEQKCKLAKHKTELDEKKVMEYDPDMYQMAKSAQMVAQMNKKDKENHDSLWDDEKKREPQDPMEIADGQEVFEDGPEIISVEDTMSSFELNE